jgi:hypothetical protein
MEPITARDFRKLLGAVSILDESLELSTLALAHRRCG